MLYWADHSSAPVRWRFPRTAIFAGAVTWALILLLVSAGRAEGQVSAGVEIRDGHGEAHVLNHRSKDVQVEVAIWESQEEPKVKLLRKAQGKIFPAKFGLAPGEKQTVRILVPDSAYAEDTLLRLETVLTPLEGEQPELTSAPENVRTELKFAYRFLSRVYIR